MNLKKKKKKKKKNVHKDEILANHRSFMSSLNIPSGKESEDLSYLYWVPKLHTTPYKERYIEGSSICSMKELSIHLTKILSAVKERQQKYCETVYSRSGINHMWILKNSKDLLDNLRLRYFSQVSSIKTFDFYAPVSRRAVLYDWVGRAGVHTGFRTITLVLYIRSLPNLVT